jgi:hypothetical protein
VNTVWKFLPPVLGALLGYLLVAPPEALADRPLVRHALMAAIAALVFVGFVAVMVLASLPENLDMKPTDRQPSPEAARQIAELERLGLRRVGRPWVLAVKPEALMVPLYDADETTVAAVYQTGTAPSKVVFELVSILDGERGGLSTSPNPATTTLPASPGALRQVLTGAPAAELLDAHRRALALLAGRGLRAARITPEGLPDAVRGSIRRQRRAVLANPLRAVLVALWRGATGTTPHRGPLEAQPIARRTIEGLLTGQRA